MLSRRHRDQGDDVNIHQFNYKNRADLFTAVLTAVLILCAGVGTVSAAVQYHNTDTDSSAVETIDSPETIDTPENVLPDSDEPTDSEPIKININTVPKISGSVLPEKYNIRVIHITQNDKLTTGCEIISTNMVINYYEHPGVDHKFMLKNLRTADLKVTKDGVLYGPTPYDAFIGDPHKTSGFGCFPPVVCNLVDNCGFDDLEAIDTTGSTIQELVEEYVIHDMPVLIWATDGMTPSQYGDEWRIVNYDGSISKRKFVWPLNEHCLVLTGYDKKNYIFADPLASKDETKYAKKTVEERYAELGQMSVVICKKEDILQ